MLQPKVTVVAHSNGHGCQRPLTTRIYTLLSNGYCRYYNEMDGWVLVQLPFHHDMHHYTRRRGRFGVLFAVLCHLCQRQKHIHNNYMV